MGDSPIFASQKFLSIKDVAGLFAVSTKTVSRWINAHELTAHKFGRQWRIDREDLKVFAEQRKSHAVRNAL